MKINLFSFLLMLFLIFNSTNNCNAQPGTIDLSFNAVDVGWDWGVNHEVSRTILQPNGKIIISGYFTMYNGKSRNYIARINEDGTLDETFNPGTGANNYILTTILQPDGKIIIGGHFTSFNGIDRNYIARLNSDGSLDTSFNPGVGANNYVLSSAIQSDGKIIVAGDFTTIDGTDRNRIARLNIDGSLDTSLDPGSGANNSVNTCVIQSDGKIIIGGYFTSYNNIAKNRITRLNVDGSLDNNFDSAFGANSYILTAVLQDDGKILIGGNFTKYNNTYINRIARLNADGSIDDSFVVGMGASQFVQAIKVQNDGKILIGGYFVYINDIWRSRFARLNIDGSLDTGFEPGFQGGPQYVSTINIQSDGKIILGGSIYTYNDITTKQLLRLNPDSSLDKAFNPITGADDYINTSLIQPDGKILIGGDFTSYNATNRNRIARLNIDGTLDGTFDPGTGANGSIFKIALQTDGKILICGQFTTINGISRNNIARLNTDGSLDNNFDPGTGADLSIRTVAVNSEGKIIIGGEFNTFNGSVRNFLALLNEDGSLNPGLANSFGVSSNHYVNKIAIQSNGKILIGGNFNSYYGKHILRVNTDYTLDLSFDPEINVDAFVHAISIQSDNKILIAHSESNFPSSGHTNSINRFNSDGSLDPTFDSGTGTDIYGYVKTIALTSDDKILIAGNFSSYNGTEIDGLAKINSNGTLDTSFETGTGSNNIETICVQDDGKIIIAGSFYTYNGTAKNRIARINNEITLATQEFNITKKMFLFPNPVSNVFQLSGLTKIENYKIYNVIGNEILNGTINNNGRVEIKYLTNGLYFFKLENGKTIKFIKK